MSGLEQLTRKIAVVTGGASGIGKGIAVKLIEAGMQVVIADVEPGALERTAREIGAVPVQTDVSSAESVAALAVETIRQFGAVHVLVNNAGVGSIATVEKMTLSDWKWMIGVNLWGVIHGIDAFLPLLRGNPEGGHLVNTASLGGLATMPEMGGYSVTKFGVVALSETLAIELAAEGSKVGVTVLCPGTVRTNIATSKRNRPGALGEGGLVDYDLENSEYGATVRWIDPEDVGEIVVAAIRRGDLYALTHPEAYPIIAVRHGQIGEAFTTASAALGISIEG